MEFPGRPAVRARHDCNRRLERALDHSRRRSEPGRSFQRSLDGFEAMKTNANAAAYAWMVVGLLWLVALLNYLDRLIITTMREPIKESIAMTDAQFGLL